MEKSSKVFVGMDVHKDSLDITLAEAGGEVRRWGGNKGVNALPYSNPTAFASAFMAWSFPPRSEFAL